MLSSNTALHQSVDLLKSSKKCVPFRVPGMLGIPTMPVLVEFPGPWGANAQWLGPVPDIGRPRARGHLLRVVVYKDIGGGTARKFIEDHPQEICRFWTPPVSKSRVDYEVLDLKHPAKHGSHGALAGPAYLGRHLSPDRLDVQPVKS